MQQFPHHYAVTARGEPDSRVTLSSPGLDSLETSAPPQFGGPEGNWSPETLLVASVVDCFILTFKAIAKASQFEWLDLSCSADGQLDKVERVTRFTHLKLVATLQVPGGTRTELAERLLQMAEKNCLVTNSMNAEVHLETRIEESAVVA